MDKGAGYRGEFSVTGTSVLGSARRCCRPRSGRNTTRYISSAKYLKSRPSMEMTGPVKKAPTLRGESEASICREATVP
jgi:hypothetical protein